MANDEFSKRVYVSEIKDVFHLEQITGNEESLKRWIIVSDINRPGLELSGYNEEAELKRVVVIGNKEAHYLNTLSYETQKDRFGFLTDSYTPCIVVTANLDVPQALIDVASEKNFPVFRFSGHTYIFFTQLVSYLSEKLADYQSINGEMISIYGVGVMITGASGMGKSELALDLIKRGHMLVADDVVEYAKINNYIVCSAPANIKKMIEVRGLGILDVTLMFGAQAFLDHCPLNFVINLVTRDAYIKNNNDRLEPTEKTMQICDQTMTVLEIPVTEGKTMASIVESAVVNYILKNRGIDTNDRFKENIRRIMIQKERGEC